MSAYRSAHYEQNRNPSTFRDPTEEEKSRFTQSELDRLKELIAFRTPRAESAAELKEWSDLLKKGAEDFAARRLPREDPPLPEAAVRATTAIFGSEETFRTREPNSRIGTLGSLPTESPRKEPVSRIVGAPDFRQGEIPIPSVPSNWEPARRYSPTKPKDDDPHETTVIERPETPDALPLQKPPESVYISSLEMVKDRRIITVEGVRQFPIPLAVWIAQTTDATLRRWIRKAVSFNGEPLQCYVSPLTGELYMSEKSVGQLENRFIKWPSKEPAGPVTIGETRDASGYLVLSDAAKLIGVGSMTLWGWASKDKAPTNIREPLDLVKCTLSDQFYLREKQARELGESRRNRRAGKS